MNSWLFGTLVAKQVSERAIIADQYEDVLMGLWCVLYPSPDSAQPTATQLNWNTGDSDKRRLDALP